MKPHHIVVVALGGGCGAVLRYVLGGWISDRTGPAFPWGTLVINATGSFVLCLLATLALERFTLSRTWYVALGVGLCGGYTTFSTFSYETLRLAAEGSWSRAAVNVLASVGAALVSGALGILVGRAI